MVFGFMKQSGGHITAYSEVGVGSTFRLYLPRAEREAAMETISTLATANPEQGRGEVVLVVEDNAALRQMLLINSSVPAIASLRLATRRKPCARSKAVSRSTSC